MVEFGRLQQEKDGNEFSTCQIHAIFAAIWFSTVAFGP